MRVPSTHAQAICKMMVLGGKRVGGCLKGSKTSRDELIAQTLGKGTMAIICYNKMACEQ